MPKKISKKRQDKIDKLAHDIVDDWDLDSVIEYAIDEMTKYLSSLNKKKFDEEWDVCYDIVKEK